MPQTEWANHSRLWFVPIPPSEPDWKWKPLESALRPTLLCRAASSNSQPAAPPAPEPPSESCHFQLCSGRSAPFRAPSNTLPGNPGPPGPCAPGYKNCAQSDPGLCRHARATQLNLQAADVSPAENFRAPRRVRTSSRTGIQNPPRDTSDERGENSPAPRAPTGPDPSRRPRSTAPPSRLTIENSALVGVGQGHPERRL